jgi:flavodoxin
MLLALIAASRAVCESSQTLVIYYSLTGYTDRIAKQIANETKADLLRFEVNSNYSGRLGYIKALGAIIAGSTPELTTTIPDFSRCSSVYVGGPVWWATVPPPLRALLKKVDFGDKKVIPFATFGGMAGRFNDKFKKLVKGGKVILNKGFSQRQQAGTSPEKGVKDWIDQL